MHQRPRITRVLAEYAGGGGVLVLIAKSLWNLPCMRHLFELAHEYAAMGVLGPIQLIGRRRGEYPLVQDTVNNFEVVSYPTIISSFVLRY